MSAQQNSSIRTPTQGAAPKEASSGAGREVQLKRAVRETEGYAAQSALLSPVQMFSPFGGLGGWGKKTEGEGTKTDAPAAKLEAGAAAKVEDASPAGPPPALPDEFGQESVLRTWIAQFNEHLSSCATPVKAKKGEPAPAKGAMENKKLDQIIALGWGNANGLDYDMLAAKAQEAEAANGAAPSGPLLTSKILAMISNARVLRGVFDAAYRAKCLQFSQKMVESMGAKRADGSKDQEKRSGAKGPLTAEHRGKSMKELPKNLPAGYQMCIVSKPEWGFTEVGNHWFISAGNGYYLDNTGGVLNGPQMTANLVNTTGDQWASRVIEPEQNSIRTKMGARFVKEHPDFQKYHGQSRAAHEKKKTVKVKENGKRVEKDNEAYRPETEAETVGKQKIKDFVVATADYHPRVWLIEPTTKADAPAKGT